MFSFQHSSPKFFAQQLSLALQNAVEDAKDQLTDLKVSLGSRTVRWVKEVRRCSEVVEFPLLTRYLWGFVVFFDHMTRSQKRGFSTDSWSSLLIAFPYNLLSFLLSVRRAHREGNARSRTEAPLSDHAESGEDVHLHAR